MAKNKVEIDSCPVNLENWRMKNDHVKQGSTVERICKTLDGYSKKGDIRSLEIGCTIINRT